MLSKNTVALMKSLWEKALREENCLKKCPFCGFEANFEQIDVGDNLIFWIVKCKHCGAQSSFEVTKPQALAKWNRRENL